jgi:hypothetical protein
MSAAREEFVLVRIKRVWVPEWVFYCYAKTLPPWVWPFRQLFTAKVATR